MVAVVVGGGVAQADSGDMAWLADADAASVGRQLACVCVCVRACASESAHPRV